MENDELITIDPKEIVLTKTAAGEILFTPKAREQLEKLLRAKKMLEQAYIHVQDVLSEAMTQNNTQKVVAGNIVVTKRVYGERFQIEDHQLATGYIKETVTTRPFVEAIDDFLERNGKLPEGIVLRERAGKVSIIERSEE